jgi:hypothetical protein
MERRSTDEEAASVTAHDQPPAASRERPPAGDAERLEMLERAEAFADIGSYPWNPSPMTSSGSGARSSTPAEIGRTDGNGPRRACRRAAGPISARSGAGP